MSDATKGPWVFDGTLDRNDQPMVTGGGVLIAIVCHECVKQMDELIANAHLIAAAPDMYEALKAMVRNGQKQGWNDGYEHDMDAARAAISKANGE